MKHEALKVAFACSLAALGAIGCSSSNNDPEKVATLGEEPVNVPSIAIQLMDSTGSPIPGVVVDIKSEDDALAKTQILRRSSGEFANKTDSTATSDEFGNIVIALVDGTKSGQLTLTVNPEKNSGFFPYTKILDIDSDTNNTELVLTKRPGSDTPDGEPASQTAQDAEGNTVENVITAVNKLVPEKDTQVDIPLGDSGTTASVQGTVAEIKTPGTTDAEKKVVAQVIIPTGATTQTSNGQPAQGDITVNAAIYQPTTSDSVSAFPGGLELSENSLETTVGENADSTIPPVIAPTTQGGIESEGFQTAGFVAIEVNDAQGNSITQFSADGDANNALGDKGLVITTLIPTSTINPETNKVVGIGDKIPVWSYNSETGKWQYDGEATIYADAGDGENYKAHFSATHLSFWNIDYRIRYCRSPLSGSDVLKAENKDKAMLEFKNRDTGERDKRTLSIEMSRKGGGFFLKKSVLGDGFVQSFRVPNFPVKLRVLDENKQEVKILGANSGDYDEANGINLCSNVTNGNDIYLAQPLIEPERNDVNIQVVTSCSDSTLDTILPPKPIPGAIIYFYQGGAYRVVDQSDDQGKSVITNLLSDSEYKLRVFARLGNSYSYKAITLNTAGAAPNPVTFDFEQECTVTTTTGSGGGN